VRPKDFFEIASIIYLDVGAASSRDSFHQYGSYRGWKPLPQSDTKIHGSQQMSFGADDRYQAAGDVAIDHYPGDLNIF
jgi:hypothetical protein